MNHLSAVGSDTDAEEMQMLFTHMFGKIVLREKYEFFFLFLLSNWCLGAFIAVPIPLM